MSTGIVVFQGMKVGFLAGDLQISLDEHGRLSSHAILSTSYSVLPIWARIAKDNLAAAKAASDDLTQHWEAADPAARKDLLIAELTPSLQVCVACGVVFDALYDHLKPYAGLDEDLLARWRKNRTSRAKQVMQVIHRTHSLQNEAVRRLGNNVSMILRLRDQAVHPSSELQRSVERTELGVGVDWKFAVYTFANSKMWYLAMVDVMIVLSEARCRSEEVAAVVRNIFKAFDELGIFEGVRRGEDYYSPNTRPAPAEAPSSSGPPGVHDA